MVGLHSLYICAGNSLATAGYISLQLFFGHIVDPCLAAVAARFGIGRDFWINIVLTLCGYIPGELIFIVNLNPHSLRPEQGHGHNFYIQVQLKHLAKVLHADGKVSKPEHQEQQKRP